MASEAEPALHLAPLLQGVDAAGASCIAADDRSGRIATVRGSSIELRVLDGSNSSVQVSSSSIPQQQSLRCLSTAVAYTGDSASSCL
jgi:hypothetical protein